ncbi:MAG: polysaccharide deacetylase family protein [Candidatus Krumholzibacteria bacterium]|jgi:hypothetical protein|nr:polysaccharide deacetylase family protein [Candidatus Krumholzibacteria bacterium]MDP6668870.1 polysaccharide deacetylase family protein [Candidatus Krumholzibacteria bacterium]MDP6797009.1 polysaccharide deacetylase family protein [Candidatus Krumholzibacteria bacterium]MDP7022224.1 polysaccharide deacetylase family protein [Candidatus Krumholzibacteria bacterium]
MSQSLRVFFRNDDVNELCPELRELTELCISEKVPIAHAVEPANVTRECVDWLLEKKAKHGRLVEIIQHGYDHTWHGKGEYGGDRPYETVQEEIRSGAKLMDRYFGDQWFRAMVFPFGYYNRASMKAVSDLGFLLMSCHWNPRLSRRLFYQAGRLLRQGLIRGRHASPHMNFYPGTRVLSVDTTVSYIRRYFGGHTGTESEWFDLDTLMARHEAAREHISTIGWITHHRYHTKPEHIKLIADSIAEMKRRDPEIRFLNYEEIYRERQDA